MLVSNKEEMVKGEEEYFELMKVIQKELPNIVLPSMGMLDEVIKIDINGKDYILNEEAKEE